MIVDEMEMVGRLRDVEPLPGEVSERAKVVLRAAIAAEGDPQVIELGHKRKRRRRVVVVRGGVAAGVAAAVAALALVASSTGLSPQVPAASNHATTSLGQSAKAPAASNHVGSPLLRLADYVSRSAAPTGNATLVAGTVNGVTVYDLYADNGECFFSRTESGLPGQVRAGNSLGGGQFAREVAAAKLAAVGNVQTAAQDMADAADPGQVASKAVPKMSTAAMKAKDVPPGYVFGSLYDNWAWENSEEALIAGAGQPQVRAGVLRIIATLPGVTVTSGTSGGQPTEVLTSGAQEVGSGYVEQVTINANTGIPVSFAGGTPGQTLVTTTYQVSRVTTSDIAAGRF